MNNVYLLTADNADWDEYQAWVVVAPDVEEAWELVMGSDAEDYMPRGYYLPSARDGKKASPGNGIKAVILGTTADEPGLRYADFHAG